MSFCISELQSPTYCFVHVLILLCRVLSRFSVNLLTHVNEWLKKQGENPSQRCNLSTNPNINNYIVCIYVLPWGRKIKRRAAWSGTLLSTNLWHVDYLFIRFLFIYIWSRTVYHWCKRYENIKKIQAVQSQEHRWSLWAGNKALHV